jgi:hypothetical protein
LNIARALARDRSGLVRIRTSDSPDAIVFIHGFKTQSLRTWGLSGAYFWPHQLGSDCETNVYCFQYDSGMIGRGNRAPLPYEDLADSLAADLMRKGHRRLVFVTHSYGGIVAKSLIVRCLERDPSYQAFTDRIFGFCPISCPNLGHPFAVAAAIVSGGLFRSEVTKILWPKRAQLQRLHERFIGSMHRLPNLEIRSLSENGYLWRLFRVPPAESRICDEPDLISPKNHRDICRNLTRDSIEYHWLSEFAAARLAAVDRCSLPC